MASKNDMADAKTDGGPTSGFRARSDLLVAAVVAVVVAASAALVGFGGLVVNVVGDRAVPVTADLDGDLSVIGASPAFTASSVGGDVAASKSTIAIWATSEGLQIGAVVVIAVALLVMAVAGYRGDPFGRGTVRWLNVAAVAAIVGFAGAVVGSFAVLEAKFDADLEPATQLSFVWLGVGAGLGALARIWSHGLSMRDELELTV